MPRQFTTVTDDLHLNSCWTLSSLRAPGHCQARRNVFVSGGYKFVRTLYSLVVKVVCLKFWHKPHLWLGGYRGYKSWTWGYSVRPVPIVPTPLPIVEWVGNVHWLKYWDALIEQSRRFLYTGEWVQNVFLLIYDPSSVCLHWFNRCIVCYCSLCVWPACLTAVSTGSSSQCFAVCSSQ